MLIIITFLYKNGAYLIKCKFYLETLRDNMGSVLAVFSNDTVDEYMSCSDSSLSTLETSNDFSKTYRIRAFLASAFLPQEGGTAAGRAAHALVSFGANIAGLQIDIPVPSSVCTLLAIHEIVDQMHQSVRVNLMKVEKSSDSICWCISRGLPVLVTLPVTVDVLDKTFENTNDDNELFAMMPVLLTGYSITSSRFSAEVPLAVYDKTIAITFEHVLSKDACDLYCLEIDVHRTSQDEQDEILSQQDDLMDSDHKQADVVSEDSLFLQ